MSRSKSPYFILLVLFLPIATPSVGQVLPGEITIGLDPDHLASVDLPEHVIELSAYHESQLSPQLECGWAPRSDFCIAPRTIWTRPQARLNEDRSIVVSADAGSVTELRISAEGLVIGDDPSPFSTVEVTDFGAIYRAENPVPLDAELELNIKLEKPTGSRPEVDVAFEFAEKEVRSGSVSVPSEDFGLFYEGLVQLRLNSDNQFVLSGDSVSVAGVEFRSQSGGLLPATESTNAWPFDVFVVNSEHSIMIGNLGSEFLLDGSVVLNAGWNPDAPTRDLVANWGYDGIPVNIDIDDGFFAALDGASSAAVPEPAGLCIVTIGLGFLLCQRRPRREMM